MHMRKKYVIAATLILAAIVCGSLVITAQNHTSETSISSGKNYKVYDISKDHKPEYRYDIYNNAGRIVKSESVFRIDPRITYPYDGVLSIHVSLGTGYFLTQYYDTNRDVFSDTFESPAMADHGMVVYAAYIGESLKLVVRDIFDINRYYKEFELDFSPVVPFNAVRKAEFADENTLDITYVSGKEYEEKNIVLQLEGTLDDTNRHQESIQSTADIPQSTRLTEAPEPAEESVDMRLAGTKADSFYIEEVARNYTSAVIDAINDNDFSRLENLLVPNSSLYDSQKKLVSDLYARNIKLELFDYDIDFDLDCLEEQGEAGIYWVYEVYVTESVGVKYPDKQDFETKEYNWVYTIVLSEDDVGISQIEEWDK